MTKQRIFIKLAAILGIVLVLLLGTISIGNASVENYPMDLIDFSTFLGGTGDDCIETVSYAFGSTTVDSKGNIIVVGRTTSEDFPLKDAFQDQLNGDSDGTISKFYPNGSLIFSTYLGGSAQEVPTDVAVDSDDNIIVAGVTGSPDFPLMNPFQSNFTGGSEGAADCFITKFSEDGQSLLFSTFFGGTGSDWSYTMNVDSDDRIAISGTTESDDFPLLNAYQDTHAGALDVFLALFEEDGQSLLFSTYLGTPGTDHGRRVDFDSHGDVLLAGMVGNGDLETEGAYQEEFGGGGADAFLTKFKANGTLVYFTFLGGDLAEWGNDMVVDSEDNIILTGFTSSDDFPILNAYQDERVASIDMFITKFTPNGQSVVFSTYFGGSSEDYGNAITIDSQDHIIVTGQTKSVDFPITIPIQRSESYYNNVSLVVLDSDGSLLVSLILGGGHHDIGFGVTWHSDHKYIIAGYTASDDFPLQEAYQDTYSGDYDMFVTKIDLQSLMVTPTSTTTTSTITNTTTTTSTTTTTVSGFPLVLVGSGIIGIVVVVVLLLVIRKRSG